MHVQQASQLGPHLGLGRPARGRAAQGSCSRATYRGSYRATLNRKRGKEAAADEAPALVPILRPCPHSNLMYPPSFPSYAPALIPILCPCPHSHLMHLPSFPSYAPALIPILWPYSMPRSWRACSTNGRMTISAPTLHPFGHCRALAQILAVACYEPNPNPNPTSNSCLHRAGISRVRRAVGNPILHHNPAIS